MSSENLSTDITQITTTPVDSLCDSDSIESDSSSRSSHDPTTRIEPFQPIGTWGAYGVDERSFCDKFRPTVQFDKYKELKLNEEEKKGCLTDRIIASCSSYLEKCPEIGRFVRCKTVLTNKGLRDIDVLKYHHFLQYIDLSRNKLKDVSILKHLPFIIHLDVSVNEIEDLLDFNPPYNLTYVNYSNNAIKYIKDLSEFWAIKVLNLSNNQISKIEGIQNLRYLETLDLSFNCITIIENLDHLNIINLNLQQNKISNFICDSQKGFKTMPVLSYVQLGHNELSSLKILENSAFLQSIDLQDNNISGLLEISHIQDLNLLLSVNLNKNPVINCDNYEAVCIETIKNLQYLDGVPIDDKKRVHAKSSFNHTTILHATQDHANLLTLSHLTKLPYLGINVIPFDLPPRPIIILVSPIGSGQDQLIKSFVKKYPKHVTRLVTHTDKETTATGDKDNYHFVAPEEFNKLLEKGEFLLVYNILNDNYGLSQEAMIHGVQQHGKVMVTSADLTAALAFRLRGFRPFLVLAMPKSKETHRLWLMETYENRVYNIKYPEAAIKIFNRANSDSLYKSSSDSSCSSVTSGLNKQYPSETQNVFENPEEYCASECLARENEECYYDVQKIQRKYCGIRNYCLLKTLYGSQYFSTDTMSEGSCLYQGGKEQTNPFYNNYSYELSCEGSTIIFPENLVQDFYSKVINSRELYLEFHRQNPGVFYDVVFTDELDLALLKLKHVAKMASRTQLEESHFKKFDHKNFDHSIIANRMKIYEDDIEKAMVRNVNCTKSN